MHEYRPSGVRKIAVSRQNIRRRIALAFNVETHESEQCYDLYHSFRQIPRALLGCLRTDTPLGNEYKIMF